jgi:hypothetical protein
MRATFPVNLILLDLVILIILLYIIYFITSYEAYYAVLCSIISPLFGPNTLLSNLISNTLSLCSYLNVRDQVSHPCKTTNTILVC